MLSKTGKTLKKLLSLTICLIMVLGSVAVGGNGIAELFDNFVVKANAEEAGYEAGDIIEFGSYPQSKIEDAELISTLEAVEKEWVSYDYYIGTGYYADGYMTSSDYMQYADFTYKGTKYRAVKISKYRPTCTGYSSSVDSSYQDENGYTAGTDNTYYFKYEPIKWKILDPSTGLVLSDAILDSQPYNNYILYYYVYSNGTYSQIGYRGDSSKSYYANNYAKSSIRDWLNDDFCNTAFSIDQQNIIQSTDLDNSAYSASYSAYDSVSTTDKIYLLSYSDVLNSIYGFSTSTSSSSTRTAQGTDYAKCQGLYVSSSGNSCWRLRSAGDYSNSACNVYYNGYVDSYYYVTSNTYCGVRAALNLNLESEIFKYEITLDANNGTGDTIKQTAYKFKEFYPECPFENKGYSFTGWFTDKQCTEEWTETDIVEGDMTLYAGWKVNVPQLRINEESNMWEVSYDNGTTWEPLGVEATGADGVGIASTSINESGELIIKLTNGNEFNLGKITGADGKDGKDGTNGTNGTDGKDGTNGTDGKDAATIVGMHYNENGELIVEMSDGTSYNAGKPTEQQSEQQEEDDNTEKLSFFQKIINFFKSIIEKIKNLF